MPLLRWWMQLLFMCCFRGRSEGGLPEWVVGEEALPDGSYPHAAMNHIALIRVVKSPQESRIPRRQAWREHVGRFVRASLGTIEPDLSPVSGHAAADIEAIEPKQD